MRNFDVIIIGAGAAGLMCARTAGQRGRRVLLLDHGDIAGAKIVISGGGRCNFTNLGAAADRYVSANPHFCKSALTGFSQFDFIDMVKRHRIAYHERKHGQLFCDDSARQIVRMLLDECNAASVDLRLNHRVTEVTKADGFTVTTDHGLFTAPAVVLATGGLSIPKMGATGFAFSVAKHFGLDVTETRPGLVPLKFSADDLELMRALTGLSFDATVSCNGKSFTEAVLFTHRGLSGPAILQVSSFWREGEAITVNLLPETDASAYLRDRRNTRPKAELKTILGEVLPNRLAQKLTETRLPNPVIGGISNKVLEQVAALLNGWSLHPTGSEGYATAEVMTGGIATGALSSKTMEARSVGGLYAIGEAVDVTGWLGGYNFQWAWSSGWCAGMAV
ncbi:MAG TPA: NAD(P)/FAD-dependent oxidoreductase [Patescibacteria group bacterium]|nr:NAD(P)/FAD-dependent oxidoreductase [Patescibacteria group bacterium]